MLLPLIVALQISLAPPSPDIRAMIRDGAQIVAAQGDGVWPDLSATPVVVQLVERDREVAFCAAPIETFVMIGPDDTTGCLMQARPRDLPTDIAGATFLGDQPVIQIGAPEALEASRADWTVLLLHEAFHLYQYRLPGYQEAVDQTGRALGASDISWILGHDFPYADPAVGDAFRELHTRALTFLAAQSDADIARAVAAYVVARAAAEAAVGPGDWPYYEFQVGQEGVARWSELRLAQMAGREDAEIAAVAAEQWAGLAVSLRAINDQGLAIWRRSSFYVLGAVEAEMLHRTSPGWQDAYRRAPFSMGTLLNDAAERLSDEPLDGAAELTGRD
jgi:hypothetical protein